MSVRNLEYLFRPSSVAVVGASVRHGRIGYVVMKNLLSGGFEGPVMPVNPKYPSVTGVLAYPDIASLPIAPELAVICTPPRTVPSLVAQLGERGTKAAIVLTAGLANTPGESGEMLTVETLQAARPHALRVLGPNCLGLLVPGVNLNASFAHMPADSGSIAFVSQSGALCTAVLDWAQSRGIGFSHFVSLGDSADVDFGDVLDYLASDPNTRSILLYIESITNARKFLSAARSAARNKTVLAVKAGRMAEGAKAAASHTGAMAGSDVVYDAAIRRSGMLRVFSIEELFYAVETLAKAKPLQGETLAIVTNGGGPGVLATDALVEAGGALSELSKQTLRRLDEILPATWSHGNPVDIIGDASEERYQKSLETVLEDKNVHSVLVMHVPTAVSSSVRAAAATRRASADGKKNVLTTWLGEQTAASARKIFAEAGLPTYETPESAIRAYMHMVNYRRNQEMLMEVPPSAAEGFRPDSAAARAVIDSVLKEGRSLLSEPEAKRVLAAYGIPTVQTETAQTPEDAEAFARRLGRPVALKILSPDISHKSDVGGVVLDLQTPERVREAAEAMLERVKVAKPGADIEGFSVQEMARRPRAHELIVGVTTDPTFGPVILFGQGGTAVEVIGDRALTLPPLNMNLARELISRTRVYKMLQGYRDRPPADLEALCLTLIKISQLVVDLGPLIELDINPLLADETGVLALDARMTVEPREGAGADRLAIRPYPKELEEWASLSSGQWVLLRPIRPEDEPAHYVLFSHFKPEDMRFRFFGLVRQLPHTEMSRFTQIDYEREMAFIATAKNDRGEAETMGVVRAVMDPANHAAEFAIIVRSDLKAQGLGKALLEKMIRYCRDHKLKFLVGQVLAENQAMLGLARRFGFEKQAADGGIVDVRLAL